VLKNEKIHRIDKVVSQPVLPSVTDLLPQFDAFLAELETSMQALYELLCEKVKGAGIIDFSALVKGFDRIEAVRTFILLLFLAQEGKVGLWQNEETEELYIAVGNLNVAKDKGTTQ
jgi:chromatin segregation and condensation protein Rec8/ScpA/Scc1 (kleisin family)